MMNYVMQLSDEDFQKTFRVNRATFALNIQRIKRSYICWQNIFFHTTRVQITHHFTLLGSRKLSINDLNVVVAQSTVSKILHEIIDIMNRVLCPKYIKFPTMEEMKDIAKYFRDNYKIPNVIGAVDGTHVAICGPKFGQFDEFMCVNRKHFHSINAEIVTDHQYRIRSVNARFPGSTNDSFIWRQSQVKQHLRKLYERKRLWILGDSGYPLEPWILTPFRNAHAEAQISFNNAHSKARAVVERCIGVLKGRWRCLKKDRALHYVPTMASKIINACAALHNICLAEDPTYLTDDAEIDDQEEVIHIEDAELYAEGDANRQAVLQYLLA